MTIATVEKWLEEPLRKFVDDARVQVALILNTSGQVLAQYGFRRSMDVMSACALASAIHATASALGREMDGRPFAGSHFAGKERQFFLAPVETRQGVQLLLAVFDHETSIGLVRLYFAEFAASMHAASPAPAERRDVTADDFERELNRNLAALFGRA